MRGLQRAAAALPCFPRRILWRRAVFPPGAMHHACWMSKAIYCLKIFLFKDQMNRTASETAGLTKICLFQLTKICLFVFFICGCYWHEAPLTEIAPQWPIYSLVEVRPVSIVCSTTQRWDRLLPWCWLVWSCPTSWMISAPIVLREQWKQNFWRQLLYFGRKLWSW